MVRIVASHRVMKLLHKNPRITQRSCTKHGAYTGPYCPECYKKAVGSDDLSVRVEKSESD